MLKRIKIGSILGNPWALLLFAALIASGLTYLAYQYLAAREERLKESMAQQRQAGVQVVVPVRDIEAGTSLSSGVFAMREIPPDLVYDDMVRAEDFAALEASQTIKPVLRGRPLRRADVEALRGRDFSDRLAPGQRAVTLEIDTINSTAKMVKPGDRIDLYWTGTPRVVNSEGATREEPRMIRLMLSNVLVLAVGQDVRPRDAGEALDDQDGRRRTEYDTVTVQIAVEDAPRVALAQRIGGLRLLLRNADEEGFTVPTGLNESNLFSAGGEAERAVEIIAGGMGRQMVRVPDEAEPARRTGPSGPSAPSTAAPAAAPQAPTHSLVDQANAIVQQLQERAPQGQNR